MTTRTLLSITAAALLAATVPATTASAQNTPIQITADLSEAPRKLYHAEVDIPVTAGPLTLTTPEWIPGEHAPNGPVNQIAGVVFTADGKQLPWRRDDIDLYQFHLTIPAGVTTLHAHLDALVGERLSHEMAVLEWERLLLYPANIPVKDIPVQPTVEVPLGWGIGTALTPLGPDLGGISENSRNVHRIQYAATTVEQLEDSPIITGHYFHEFPLAPEVTPKHFIDVVSDSAEDSNLKPELLANLSNLVRETGAAYDFRHYNVYHFLLTLSDVAGGEGLEHGQSSDNGVGEKGFADEPHILANADLLSHEFTHSWNGKYRRPIGLYQPDFATPQQGALLWVYEGMTQYMGNVLAARDGMRTPDQYRDVLALSAASLDYEPGRDWRSTEDTAIASSVDRHPTLWANWVRGQAYYQEGELLWLDADTLIRQLTKNKKSLTDFQHIFLGQGGNTGPLIVTYDRAELIRDLNEVVPYDWATFFHEHIDLANPHTDLAGIERGGYKLVYTDKASKSQDQLTAAGGTRSGSFWYSIGLKVSTTGVVSDVLWGGPSDKAKLAPGQKIIAVNGNIFSAAALKSAVRQSKDSTEPIHLILQSDTFVSFADINYHDGERYPSLVRVDGTPAYLDDIIKPLTKPEK
jgi:predicted metalloprotease with PDZ domain